MLRTFHDRSSHGKPKRQSYLAHTYTPHKASPTTLGITPGSAEAQLLRGSSHKHYSSTFNSEERERAMRLVQECQAVYVSMRWVHAN